MAHEKHNTATLPGGMEPLPPPPSIGDPPPQESEPLAYDHGNIRLRAMTNLDIPMLMEWVSESPDILEGMQMPPDTDIATLAAGAQVALQDQSQWWLVAERGGGPIGIVAATGVDYALGIATPHIIVSPEHRHGKTYWKLHQAAIAFAGQTGLNQLVAFVPRGNKVALRANRKAGFEDKDVVMQVLDLRESDNGTGPGN